MNLEFINAHIPRERKREGIFLKLCLHLIQWTSKWVFPVKTWIWIFVIISFYYYFIDIPVGKGKPRIILKISSGPSWKIIPQFQLERIKCDRLRENYVRIRFASEQISLFPIRHFYFNKDWMFHFLFNLPRVKTYNFLFPHVRPAPHYWIKRVVKFRAHNCQVWYEIKWKSIREKRVAKRGAPPPGAQSITYVPHSLTHLRRRDTAEKKNWIKLRSTIRPCFSSRTKLEHN